MQYNQIAEQLTFDVFSTTLPHDDEGLNSSPVEREAAYGELSEEVARKRAQRELRRYRTNQRIRAKSLRDPDAVTDAEASIALADKLEAETMPYTAELIRSNPNVLSPSDIVQVDSLLSSRSPALSRLLRNLNLTLDQGLTKTDTDNLLSALLVASESQLETLLHNPDVPIAIKTIIRRLLLDATRGDTAAVERLWDRLFGKPSNALAIATPTTANHAPTQQTDTGVIPSTPISREAFVILRETLMN